MKHSLDYKSRIPSAGTLRSRLQALAMIDAIMEADWEFRYFSFNSKWMDGQMMGSMRDGEGSEFFFLFDEVGIAGKIYCSGHHKGGLDQVPSEFTAFLSEPAFSLNQVTCCLWQRTNEHDWSVVPSGISKIPLLAFVADQGYYYRKWAEHYYDTSLSSEGVAAVFGHRSLTRDFLVSITKNPDFKRIASDASEIGYPVDY